MSVQATKGESPEKEYGTLAKIWKEKQLNVQPDCSPDADFRRHEAPTGGGMRYGMRRWRRAAFRRHPMVFPSFYSNFWLIFGKL